MDLGLDGRVAVVGASSRGLGRAVARRLAAEGADVVVNARGEERLRETADEIRDETDASVVPVPADLSEEDGARRVVDRALDAFDRIDVLVTNAGGPPAGPFEEHGMEDWRRAVELTLESALRLTRGVLPGMKDRGWGRILNITSIAVKQPVDGLVLSNSVRAAVTGMARTLANEVAAHGITVNNVMPGYTRTRRTEELARTIAEKEGITEREARARWEEEIPAGRLAEPEEFASLVAYLASERASYITGTSVPVDGGWIRTLL